MWDKFYKVGKLKLHAYDWAMNWKHHLYNDIKLNEAAVTAAKRNGMEMFLYTGIFEHGVQPDVGVIAPYQFEDQLRRDHPEWCPLDRWGQRRSPGPLSFCYPEVRKILIQRYVDNVTKYDYDGINFYTYVENLGMRYQDEFGFNQPIVDEFKKKYPTVNLRQDKLSQIQREHWYKCRGKFLTQFLAELHNKLNAKGKTLSVILDAKEPHYPQTWWSNRAVIGTGKIYMDYEKWINDGIVDELWVQLGAGNDQRKLLDELLIKCKDKPVKLTVRAPAPFESAWAPYVEAGVTPIAVITWARNGIERITLESTSLQTLKSPDWKLRAQTLADIASGKISATLSDIEFLAHDPHVLVRQRLTKAVKALADANGTYILEKALTDHQSSVRIAAADALSQINNPESPKQIISALEKNHYFQFKMACRDALSAMSDKSLPALLTGLKSPTVDVREVCVQALYKLGKAQMLDDVYQPLRKPMLDSSEYYTVRCFAIEGLVGLRLQLSDQQRQQLASNLITIINDNSSTHIQLYATEFSAYMLNYMTPSQKEKALNVLKNLFAQYGDQCTRPDAAYGWRIVGNTLAAMGPQGKMTLQSMRKQKKDKWLAWAAYQVLYVVQKKTGKNTGFNLVDENLAIENHKKYVPEFPGWRKW